MSELAYGPNTGALEGLPVLGPSQAGKIFVGGISELTEDDLKTFFEENFGPVRDVFIMKDKMSGKARGFAFVTFADSANAEVACRQRQNIKGRPVECKFAVPRDEQLTIKTQAEQPGGGGERVTKIFVGGLEPSCTEPEFKAYWDNWGTVQEAEIKVDPYTKKSRGFGFITFTDSDMVERVMMKTDHTIKGKMVECKKAQSRQTLQRIDSAKTGAAPGMPYNMAGRGAGAGGFPPMMGGVPAVGMRGMAAGMAGMAGMPMPGGFPEMMRNMYNTMYAGGAMPGAAPAAPGRSTIPPGMRPPPGRGMDPYGGSMASFTATAQTGYPQAFGGSAPAAGGYPAEFGGAGGFAGGVQAVSAAAAAAAGGEKDWSAEWAEYYRQQAALNGAPAAAPAPAVADPYGGYGAQPQVQQAYLPQPMGSVPQEDYSPAAVSNLQGGAGGWAYGGDVGGGGVMGGGAVQPAFAAGGRAPPPGRAPAPGGGVQQRYHPYGR